eukprot:Colp12_sorted_trinity150504_noHs@3563
MKREEDIEQHSVEQGPESVHSASTPVNAGPVAVTKPKGKASRIKGLNEAWGVRKVKKWERKKVLIKTIGGSFWQSVWQAEDTPANPVVAEAQSNSVREATHSVRDVVEAVVSRSPSAKEQPQPLVVNGMTTPSTLQSTPSGTPLSGTPVLEIKLVKKYPCSVDGCLKSFGDSSKLKRHMLSHERKDKIKAEKAAEALRRLEEQKEKLAVPLDIPIAMEV